MFKFIDPGPLLDQDIELKVADVYNGNLIGGHVPSYRFSILRAGESIKMGEVELRVGNTEHILLYAGHIGYEIYPRFRGQHRAARSVKLLLPLAWELGLHTLWITCNPDNYASRRTCELAGFTYVETVDIPPSNILYREGDRQKCRYRRILRAQS